MRGSSLSLANYVAEVKDGVVILLALQFHSSFQLHSQLSVLAALLRFLPVTV